MLTSVVGQPLLRGFEGQESFTILDTFGCDPAQPLESSEFHHGNDLQGGANNRRRVLYAGQGGAQGRVYQGCTLPVLDWAHVFKAYVYLYRLGKWIMDPLANQMGVLRQLLRSSMP